MRLPLVCFELVGKFCFELVGKFSADVKFSDHRSVNTCRLNQGVTTVTALTASLGLLSYPKNNQILNACKIWLFM